MIDEFDLIRRSTAALPGPDAATMARLRGQLRELIAEEEERQSGLEVARARRRRLRYGLLGASAAATVLVAALVIPGIERSSPSAAAILEQEARVAAGQPSETPLGPGQYMFTSSVGAYLQTAVFGGGATGPSGSSTGIEVASQLVPVTREIWEAANGSGRIREVYGTGTFLSPTDREVWVANGSPDVFNSGTSQDSTYAPGKLSGPSLADLPTDPAALGTLIDERKVEGGPPGDAETFTIIGDLLRETDASPALRAALYEVAAQLPGVELLGTIRDETGQSGTGVAYESDGEQHQLIFDPATSELIGERYVVTDPSATKLHVTSGAVVEWTSYLQHGVVDSETATPDGGQIPEQTQA